MGLSADGATNAARVRAFHAAVGDAPVAVPQVPSAAVLALRRALITEEYHEVVAALDGAAMAGDGAARSAALAHLAHELADLLYVTYGTFVACGVDADAIFAEVHRANLAKARGPRRADGKQLRPPGWTPADVAAVIARQTTR